MRSQPFGDGLGKGREEIMGRGKNEWLILTTPVTMDQVVKKRREGGNEGRSAGRRLQMSSGIRVGKETAARCNATVKCRRTQAQAQGTR